MITHLHIVVVKRRPESLFLLLSAWDEKVLFFHHAWENHGSQLDLPRVEVSA